MKRIGIFLLFLWVQWVPSTALAYLGLHDGLCRWPGETIKVLYNPRGAPEIFDEFKMIRYIERAFGEWEKHTRLKVFIQGITDKNWDQIQEGYVLFQWDHLKPIGKINPQGLGTGSCLQNIDERLGYRPIVKGWMVLANDSEKWTGYNIEKENMFVRVLVHELGHVLGLGHSDHPYSLMYANPYNDLLFLTDDDIEAAQAIYGVPEAGYDNFFKSRSPYYSKKPLEPPAKTEKVIIFHQKDTAKTPIKHITDDFPYKEGSLGIQITFSGFPNPSQLQLIVLDPYGNIRAQNVVDVDRSQGRLTYHGFLLQVKELLSVPGNWHLFGIVQDRVALHEVIMARGTPTWNQRPKVKLVLDKEEGVAPLTISATLEAEDPEKDNVSTVWYIPGEKQPRKFLLKSSLSQSMTFPLPGEYTFFVEVNDDAPRYPGAGEGFRYLIYKDIRVQSR